MRPRDLAPRAARALRTPEGIVLAGFAIALIAGSGWGLPGTDSWAADSISPRSCGLGAIVETYRPGHFHTYPPLHMAILTALSLPWMALAAARVGLDTAALGAELVKPLYMTGIEASARLVTGAMALGIVWAATRFWTRAAGRRAGVAAGIAAACDGVLVYYGHTGNLDVPCLFWVSLSLLEAQRVLEGEARELRAALYAACGVLTKDAAAAALLLPLSAAAAVALARAPTGAPRRALLRRIAAACLASAAVYALASGAVVNPSGYARRLAFLLGPASQTWAGYPRGLRGALVLAADAARAVPRFGSWPLAIAALAGVAIALSSRSRDRAVLALPLAAAASYALLFDLGARRSDDRFLLPQAVLLFPYAALAYDRARSAWPARAVAAACAACLAPAILGVASIDATLLADPRYAAERFLAALPAGTRVEVYGGPIFLPRIPPSLSASRPGVEPLADRQAIAGVRDVVDPAMDPRPRAPDYIVLSAELSSEAVTHPPARPHPYGLMSYHDAASHRLLRGLYDGSLGYVRAGAFACSLPWPLECRSIHGSTAGPIWIYARRGLQRDRS